MIKEYREEWRCKLKGLVVPHLAGISTASVEAINAGCSAEVGLGTWARVAVIVDRGLVRGSEWCCRRGGIHVSNCWQKMEGANIGDALNSRVVTDREARGALSKALRQSILNYGRR